MSSGLEESGPSRCQIDAVPRGRACTEDGTRGAGAEERDQAADGREPWDTGGQRLQ